MIYVYTGSNGSGKTLNAIKFIVEELNPDGDRPVFYYSPPTQPIGIAEAGVLDWQAAEVDQIHRWYDLPEGSIIFVDEFRHVWPWRDHKTPPPETVDRLAEHRSKGFDFVLTAQKPSAQFDPAIQGFIEEHRHLVGIKGAQRSTHYIYEAFCSSPLNPPKLQPPEVEVVKFDKKYFSYYRSASLHTHKDRRSFKKLYLFGAAVLAVPFLFWLAFSSLDKMLPGDDTPPLEDLDYAANPFMPAALSQPSTYIAPDDYWTKQTPRVPGLPHTAPMYDSLTEPVSAPMPRGCILHVKQDTCTCYTQQATKMQVPDEFCRSAVAHGWFDGTRPDLARAEAQNWEYMTTTND